MSLAIAGIGLVAAGVPDWASAAPLLRAGEGLPAGELVPPPAAALAPAERRRTTALIRLAVAAAGQACGGREDVSQIQSVFASTHGDMATCDALCRALAMPERPVSPTQFHNSVHNAPACYWSLVTGARAPSTSLSSLAGAVAAGLLEAWAQAKAEDRPVLLVGYEYPGPSPIGVHARLHQGFGLALLFDPMGQGRSIDVRLERDTEQPVDEGMVGGLASGRGLIALMPLLCRLAQGTGGTLSLAYRPGWRLGIEVGGA